MKLSMWHILQELEEYAPEYQIVDGAPRIAGLHLHTRRDDDARLGQYACLELLGEATLPMAEGDRVTMAITNGPDRITVKDLPDSSEIINRLMALLASFNDWEGRLRNAAERGDLQEVADVATEKLMNPILLFDLPGNVLAMSSLYLDDTRNEFWNACRENRRVPVSYAAMPLTLENGKTAAWTREPRLYIMPDGSKSIGNLLNIEGENVAGFALHEMDNPILPGDLHLVRLVEDAMLGALQPQHESGAQRSLIHSLQDMLSGVRYEDTLYNLFRLPCPAPWRLALVDNPSLKQSDALLYRQLLLPRLRSLLPQCLAMEFDTHLVVLASVEDADALVKVVRDTAEAQWMSVCLSLPFDSLRLLHNRYLQTRFVLERFGGKSGIYRAEDHALRYLASLPIAQSQQLQHPLLKALKEQDERKGSDLYQTLFQYLIHERSIQKGAAALHVHKNTYSYRLDRIRELTDVDLNDPVTRLYLMVSYVIDGALEGDSE